MLLKSKVLVGGAVAMLALSACNPSSPEKATAEKKPVVAAKVNGAIIGESRVELLAQQGAAPGQSIKPEVRKEIIERLALLMLISQEAVNKGFHKKPELADQLDLIRQTTLANAFVEDYVKNTPVTDDALKAEYERIKAEVKGSEYKARHILVAKEADAKDIIAKLKKNPKSFESLAKEKSTDPGSKNKGGDLGWFDPRGMVPEFGAAVAKLNKGQFTAEPVKSQFGFHVIMLEDSRATSIPPLEQVKPMLQQQLQQKNLKKLYDDLKAKAKIEIVQAPAASAPAKEETPAKSGK